MSNNTDVKTKKGIFRSLKPHLGALTVMNIVTMIVYAYLNDITAPHAFDVFLKAIEIDVFIITVLYAHQHLSFLEKQDSERKIQASRQASTRLIFENDKNLEVRDAKAKIRMLTNNFRRNLELVSFPNALSEVKISSKSNAKIDDVMNDVQACLEYYEIVATAIKYKVIDEDVFQDFNRSSYVKTWQCLDEFIGEYRHQKKWDLAYKNYQDLAVQWAEKTDEAENND